MHRVSGWFVTPGIVCTVLSFVLSPLLLCCMRCCLPDCLFSFPGRGAWHSSQSNYPRWLFSGRCAVVVHGAAVGGSGGGCDCQVGVRSHCDGGGSVCDGLCVAVVRRCAMYRFRCHPALHGVGVVVGFHRLLLRGSMHPLLCVTVAHNCACHACCTSGFVALHDQIPAIAICGGGEHQQGCCS